MLETKVMFNATEITIKVSVWARGDPFPAIGSTCATCLSVHKVPLARERH